MVAALGIEPRSASYEDAVLPLNDAALAAPAGLEPATLRIEADRANPVALRSGMVCVTGFEPATSRFQGGNSTGLSYTQIAQPHEWLGCSPVSRSWRDRSHDWIGTPCPQS
jgi:hypothetical protein